MSRPVATRLRGRRRIPQLPLESPAGGDSRVLDARCAHRCVTRPKRSHAPERKRAVVVRMRQEKEEEERTAVSAPRFRTAEHPRNSLLAVPLFKPSDSHRRGGRTTAGRFK